MIKKDQTCLSKHLLPVVLLLCAMLLCWVPVNAADTITECENMTTGGTYAGKITSPFNGVALYANNDYCAYSQYFSSSTHSFSVRGCSSNSSTARVDLKIGGAMVGSFYFTGTAPTVQTLSNITHGTGNQEVRLTVTTDNGTWDVYMDYLQIGGSDSDPTPGSPWNWVGIVGTGQSLSVGATPVLSTTQPYNNLKLSLGSLKVPPYDANSSALKMVPLVEPIRSLATSFPGAYPANIWGETPHTSMANQITSMVKSAGGADYITAHTVVGESGQGISVIRKGATDTGNTGRAYAASIFEVTAINRLAKAAGKTYGVGGITLIHGETDCGSPTYESDIRKLWSDYNQDIKAITGQTQKIPMFLVQQHSYPSTGTSASTLAQWKAGVDYAGDIICIGPNYQRYYGSDHVHLVSSGYQQLGEKFAQVYYERVVLGRDWQPLQPTSATKSGRVITVNLHVPVAPLVWDSTLPAPNQNSQTEWKNGKGFEVTANGSRVTISSVEISGSSVKITCANDLPASGVNVGYAFTGGTARANGSYRWGLLRDSDPFKGSITGVSQPNFCVAFQMAVQ